MWQDGAQQIYPSVAVVLEHLTAELPDGSFEYWHVLGSAFRVGDEHMTGGGLEPRFLTNEHVVRERPGYLQVRIKDSPEAGAHAGEMIDMVREELALSAIIPADNGHEVALAGAAVRAVEPDRDLAVLAASEEGEQIRPVTFRDRTPLSIGTPVAAMGYPLQEDPELEPGEGHLRLERRFAAGWLGGDERTVEIDEAPEFVHYEIDIKAYPGISGAACFDRDGRVVGLMRGGLSVGDATVYGYAVRNQELLGLLDDLDFDLEYREDG